MVQEGGDLNVVESYQRAIAQRGFIADPAQQAAVTRLQQLHDDLEVFRSRRNSAWKRLVVNPPAPRGVYLWGGVGRGKSFLMDSFYSSVQVRRKVRIHFHEFMRAVHRQLDELKGMQDPLDEAAKRIAKKYRLICFDEFHVSDIADAMILYRLLTGLFNAGTVFIMTSNYAPDGLYPDGLHRDRVLPAIALLKNKLDVLNVDSGIDYRRRALEQVQAYHWPLGAVTDRALRHAFNDIAEVPDENPVLQIEARQIRALRRAGGIVWFDFTTLCVGPRSQNDYLEIASQFHTVMLSGVPRLSAAMSSEARRFTWLIDVLYDYRTKLIMSAEVAADALYTAGALSTEFHRTVSRLTEMQSREYLQSGRRSGLVPL